MIILLTFCSQRIISDASWPIYEAFYNKTSVCMTVICMMILIQVGFKSFLYPGDDDNENEVVFPVEYYKIAKQECNESMKNNICSICRENLSNCVIILACNHIFHKDCLLPWLAINSRCCECRSAVIFQGKNKQIENR